MSEPDYKDDTGKSIPLSTLCRTNPEWAASHIKNIRQLTPQVLRPSDVQAAFRAGFRKGISYAHKPITNVDQREERHWQDFMYDGDRQE